MEISRRKLLAIAGAGASGMAGCSGTNVERPSTDSDWRTLADTTDTETTTNSPTRTPTRTPKLNTGSTTVESLLIGVPDESYPESSTQITEAGYQIKWVDAYQVGEQLYFNSVFNQFSGSLIEMSRNLTADQFQSTFDRLIGQGFHLKQIDSYIYAGNLYFSGIFENRAYREWYAFHGLNRQGYEEMYKELSDKQLQPVNLSVASVGGERRYSMLFQRRIAENVHVETELSPSDLESTIEYQASTGRSLRYINAYMNQDDSYFSAIWYPDDGSDIQVYHGLSRSQLDDLNGRNEMSGYNIVALTGYSEGGSHRFAAVWQN